jgi:hypothetical protein
MDKGFPKDLLFDAIWEDAHTLVFLLDGQGRVLEINETCRRTFFDRFGVAVAAGDVLPEKVSAGLVPGMNDRMREAFGGNPVSGEAGYPDGEGNEQTIEYFLHPVRNPGGEITAVAAYARNVSERKRRQQQTLAQELAAQRLEAASLIAGQEQERVRLVAELHDGIGQMLNVLKLKIDTLAEGPPPDAYRLWALSEFTSRIIAEIKRVVQDAMPYNLEHLGLDGAIRTLCTRFESQGKVQFRVWVTLTQGRFEKPLEMFVYRAVQESLHNAVRHANARNVTVQLTQFPGHLLVMVEDDGVGFRVADALKPTTARGGLRHLVERCRLAGADLDIDSQPGHGCTLTIKVPL